MTTETPKPVEVRQADEEKLARIHAVKHARQKDLTRPEAQSLPTVSEADGLAAENRLNIHARLADYPGGEIGFKRDAFAALRAQPSNDAEGWREGMERAAKIVSDKAQQWRDFADMALPAMPDPAVCRVHAQKADELAATIRAALNPEGSDHAG